MNRIVSFDKKNNIVDYNINSKVAIFIYFYYKETANNYIKYFQSIPEKVDIYVITPNLELANCIQQKANRTLTFIQMENRGRDVAALLVAARPYILKYDYFCFIHDKKEKNNSMLDYTNKWINLLWENMLASKAYVEAVINYFEQNNNVGILFPPAPIGEYANVWYSGFWGINYANAMAVAKKIGVNTELLEQEEPISVGTVFWARVKALHKLLDYSWKHTDFPNEPLPDDGAISHAIERLLLYVVKDAGYFAKICTTQDYLENYTESVLQEYRKAAGLLYDQYGIYPSIVREYEEKKKSVLEFLNNKADIYIYGAGAVGSSCYRYLKSFGITITGYVISSMPQEKYKDSIPIYCIDNVKNIKQSAFIVAAREDNKKNILKKLEEIDCTNYMIYI